MTIDGPLFADNAVQAMEQAASLALLKFAQQAEGHAKAELSPGHGVRTGRLQRSIVGRLTAPLVAIVAADEGSGTALVYAAAIEYGWPLGYPGLRGAFAGYGYMAAGQAWAESADLDTAIGPVIVEALS